jgi:hypothetical protein
MSIPRWTLCQTRRLEPPCLRVRREVSVLVRVDHVLDPRWLPREVAGLDCAEICRPSVDPEVAVRLMLAGLLFGIVDDRRLMREAQVSLAIRWFIS